MSAKKIVSLETVLVLLSVEITLHVLELAVDVFQLLAYQQIFP